MISLFHMCSLNTSASTKHRQQSPNCDDTNDVLWQMVRRVNNHSFYFSPWIWSNSATSNKDAKYIIAKKKKKEYIKLPDEKEEQQQALQSHLWSHWAFTDLTQLSKASYLSSTTVAQPRRLGTWPGPLVQSWLCLSKNYEISVLCF